MSKGRRPPSRPSARRGSAAGRSRPRSGAPRPVRRRRVTWRSVAIAVVTLVGVALVVLACTPEGTDDPQDSQTATDDPSSTTTGTQESTVAQWSTPPAMAIDTEREYEAIVRTSKGDITIRLLAAESPTTVNNFVFLARQGFYDGVIFHRVIEGFMIQGGDPTGTGTGGPGYRFDDELDAARALGYRMGTVAMANAGPNTNGSQFFIMHADYGLPPSYSVFGKVIDGLDVVDAIARTPRNPSDRPLEDVVITTVEITER